MSQLQAKFWDWATRNAIRFGTVLVVIETVARATARGLRGHHGDRR